MKKFIYLFIVILLQTKILFAQLTVSKQDVGIQPTIYTSNIAVVDTSSFQENVGGSISFTGYYNKVDLLKGAPYIKAYKENSTIQDSGFGLKFGTKEDDQNRSTKLTLTGKGNLGISTESPGYKLDVVGTIHANEIKVDTEGADYVFNKNYELMSLKNLSNYVKKHKHLPDIAPADSMKANGANLGELNRKLLQKIEELTLYTIEQQKQYQEQKRINVSQSELIQKLQERLDKLEAKK